MSRRIVGYLDGIAQWEDLGPSENIQWGARLGGSAIQPQPSEADRHRADAAKNREKVRGLRGEKLK